MRSAFWFVGSTPWNFKGSPINSNFNNENCQINNFSDWLDKIFGRSDFWFVGFRHLKISKEAKIKNHINNKNCQVNNFIGKLEKLVGGSDFKKKENCRKQQKLSNQQFYW